MSFNVEELASWDDRIKELVERFGLKCYPQEFEICDHNEKHLEDVMTSRQVRSSLG